MPHRPEVPCSGGCGNLLWRSTTSRPPGEMMCRPCRRERYGQPGHKGHYEAHPRTPSPVITVHCEWCTQPFTKAKGKRFCSTRCAGKQRKGNTETVIPWVSCLHCRRWFVARLTRRQCPYLECQQAQHDQEQEVTATCLQCLLPFTYRRTGRSRLYCSRSCGRLSPTAKATKRTGKAVRRARMKQAPYESFDPHEVFDRDDWRCGLCGRLTDRTAEVPDPRAATLDHVVPLSKGGPHTRANTQCACFECNWRKADGVLKPEQLALLG